jgi:predicted 2-oxoglutarate/Fe(II)-dependent dioxygenase YbiX
MSSSEITALQTKRIDEAYKAGIRNRDLEIAYQSGPVFSPAECKALRKKLMKIEGREGLVYSGFGNPIVNREQYDATEYFLDPSKPKFKWFIDRILPHVLAAGEQFGMEGLELEEQARMVVYGEGGHFGWHPDSGPGNNRRLTMSIQLTSPKKYTGGHLLVMGADGDWTTASRKQGALCVFDACRWHRAMPVQGERHAFVMCFY